MHPNPNFRKATDADNLAFARQRSFGTLCINADPAPLLSHVPYILTPDGNHLELHLVRSNPILQRGPTPTPAVMSVSGSDSYVSPDWYEAADQVPTWNYIAVHLRGELQRLPQDELRGHLDRLSQHFESRLLPKPPWMTGKVTPDILNKMMRMIVPCRMSVVEIEGTWKLNQNKPDALRLAAAQHVDANGIGQETGALSILMNAVPKS